MRTENHNNVACFTGTIAPPGVAFHHNNRTTSFYVFYLEIQRLSQASDIVPVIISQSIYDLYLEQLHIGQRVNVVGELRSYNETNPQTGKRHVRVFAHANNVSLSNSEEDRNDVTINCHICKDPNYRTTPNGRRITDLMLAINRDYNMTDYIPAIAWGSIADLSANITTRDNIYIKGRFQSRQYTKKHDNDTVTIGTSYELSISELVVINSDDDENY